MSFTYSQFTTQSLDNIINLGSIWLRCFLIKRASKLTGKPGKSLPPAGKSRIRKSSNIVPSMIKEKRVLGGGMQAEQGGSPGKEKAGREPRPQLSSSQSERLKQEKTRVNQRVKEAKGEAVLSGADCGLHTAFLDEQKIEKMKTVLLQIHEWTLDTLKEALRKNQQSTSGSKLDLLTKVADGMVFGKTPRCSVCHNGHLKMDFSSGIYYCAGFHEGNTHLCCKSRFPYQAVERQPWND